MEISLKSLPPKIMSHWVFETLKKVKFTLECGEFFCLFYKFKFKSLLFVELFENVGIDCLCLFNKARALG